MANIESNHHLTHSRRIYDITSHDLHPPRRVNARLYCLSHGLILRISRTTTIDNMSTEEATQNPTAAAAPGQEAYEEEHVHSVYEQIASHFSSTRYKVGNRIMFGMFSFSSSPSIHQVNPTGSIITNRFLSIPKMQKEKTGETKKKKSQPFSSHTRFPIPSFFHTNRFPNTDTNFKKIQGNQK
jgi:hypothetical protein